MEAEAEALSEVFEANWSELATKRDIIESRQETKRDIAELRHEIGDLCKDLQRAEERFDTKPGQAKVRASQMAYRANYSSGWFSDRPAEIFGVKN